MTRIVDDVPCPHAIKRNSGQTVSLCHFSSSDHHAIASGVVLATPEEILWREVRGARFPI